jgi:hypothetical protein
MKVTPSSHFRLDFRYRQDRDNPCVGGSNPKMASRSDGDYCELSRKSWESLRRQVLGNKIYRSIGSNITGICIAYHNSAADTGYPHFIFLIHTKGAIMPKLKPVVKEGKVVSANRKFYVTIGRTRREIPTGLFVNAGDLKKLAGQTVSVTTLGKSIVAIGRRPGGGILCYVPAPEAFLGELIQPELQRLLQKKYTEAGIIPG